MIRKIVGTKCHGGHHKCHFCQKSFVTVGSRNDHERNIHEKLRPYKCDQCEKRFYRKFNLKVHKRKHSSDYPYSCEICNKSFKSHFSVQIHMKNHTNQRPFMCEVCGKVFKTMAVLDVHSNVHTKHNRYDCTICGKSYSYRASLFVHMRTHTGQRPYQCKECDSSFMVKSHLTDHIRRHTKERPFECKYCFSLFFRTVSLKKHLRSHLRAGMEIDAEAALLYAKLKAQNRAKKSVVSLDRGAQPPPKVIQYNYDDTSSIDNEGDSLNQITVNIVLHANLSDEEELVTIVISCNDNEELCSVKQDDPSVNIIDDSQKVIVKNANAYDTNCVINDRELCFSKVIKDNTNSQLSSVYERFDCPYMDKECFIIPEDSNRYEDQSKALSQFPTHCKSFPEITDLVSKSNTEWLSSQSVLSADDSLKSVVNDEYDYKSLKGDAQIINRVSDYNIHEVLSEFNEDQGVVGVSPGQVSVGDHHIEGSGSAISSKIHHSIVKKKPLRECKYCGLQYKYLACLKVHEKKHEDVPEICDKRHQIINSQFDSPSQPYVTIDNINNSIDSVTKENCAFSCEICGLGFSFRSRLRKHVKLHSRKYSHVCKKCNQAFQHEVFYNKHNCVSSYHSSLPEPSIFTKPSEPHNFTIPSEQNISTVISAINIKNDQEYACKRCGTVSQMMFIGGASDSNCTEQLCNKCYGSDEQTCESKLPLTKNLLETERDETEPIEKEKSGASDCCSSQIHFQEEVYLQEKERESEVIEDFRIENEAQSDFQKFEDLSSVIEDLNDVVSFGKSLPLLDKCGLNVKVQKAGQKKMTRANKFKLSNIKKSSNLLKCRYCPMLFAFNSTLRSHERSHTGEKPYSCPTCKKTFSKKSNMEIHKRIHTGERPFLCDFCGKYFSYKYSLDTHKRLHTKELPFVCFICGKGFRYKSSRSVHFKRHKGIKAFKCDLCSKSFVSKIEKEDHMRIHTGEKPYHCEHCGQNFSHRHHLVDHRRIHTGHKPYKCAVCNVGFRRLGMLKSHEQKHVSHIKP